MVVVNLEIPAPPIPQIISVPIPYPVIVEPPLPSLRSYATEEQIDNAIWWETSCPIITKGLIIEGIIITIGIIAFYILIKNQGGIYIWQP